ncbi:MAG TPA: bifunctional homocysteine S-methyltransferase/methylenetetrahydrofolate reductase, partial [Desulfobacteraceae bacterium]|nr:bifunctional homocysteine S-methyltransferase/methylenetetrahydrofolate reductase [Desulfobacteraceae bacterium]
MKPDFVEYLKDHVVLGDGALGSYLYEKGIERGRNLDLLNLHAADFVFSAHEEYIRAGSQLIETNTFGANHFRLREVGAQHRAGEINRAGAGIAVKAAGHQVYVAGSVGPTGLTFPLDEDEVREEDIRQAFNEQIAAL